MNKKFISAIMAGAMAISALGVSASAAITANKQDNADYGTKAQSYKIAAAVTVPEMKVTLPSAVSAVINPYNVKVKVNEEAIVATNGIVSPIYTITNNSTDLGIKVTATTSATATTGIKMVDETFEAKGETYTDAWKATSTDGTKEAFAQVMVGLAADSTLKAPKDAAIFETVAEGAEATSVELFSLKAAANATTGEKGHFQIQGEISRCYTKGSEEVEQKWGSTDKVNLVLVLDITPANVTASKIPS